MHTRWIRSRSALSIVAVGLVVSCGAGGDETVPSAPLAPSATTTNNGSDDLFTSGDRIDDVAVDSTTTARASTTTAAPTSSSTSSPSTTVGPTTTIASAAPASVATITTTIASTTTTTGASTTTRPLGEGNSPCPPTGSRIWEVRPASDIPAPPLPDGWRVESAGTSVQGRDLRVLVRPVESPSRTVMVIGGIHGNEPVSPPTVRAMVDAALPADTELWLLPDLNPDGSAVGTRCNARGVDLNRNFSWGWRADNGGPRAFSEPESAAAVALIERAGPDLVVWVHQPLGYVSSIGATPDSYEQAWAGPSGVPVRRDVSQQGGGESWTAFVAGIPSMLIEVDTYDARPDMVTSHVAGFRALLDVVVPR